MSWYDALPDPLPTDAHRWASPEFREEVADWVGEVAAPVLAMEQVKLRPWATVWRVDTTAGAFFAKQNCRAQAFEAALVAELAQWVPHRIVPVRATDPDRDLLLTYDQGSVLGEQAGDDLDEWCRVVAAAADLQRRVAPYAGRMGDLGLTTLATADAPSYVEARVQQLHSLPHGDPRRVSTADAAAIRAHAPVIQGWVDAVAGLGLPTTLQHGDLHERNVFGGAGLRFFDFADAVLSDPLGVLLIPLNILGMTFDAGADDPRLRRVADAYLEVWSDLAPMSELRAALPAGLQLGRLARIESWLRVTAAMDAAAVDEWGSAVPAWMATLCADPPVTF